MKATGRSERSSENFLHEYKTGYKSPIVKVNRKTDPRPAAIVIRGKKP